MSNKISIIMPAFNVGANVSLFEKCIEHLLNQSFTNWELLIGADGDGNVDKKDIKIITSVLNKRKDGRIKLYTYTNKKCAGPGLMRNFLYKYSSGNFITFHDTDDFSKKNRLKILLEKIQEEKCDIVASDIFINRLEAPTESKVKGYSGENLDIFLNFNKIRTPICVSSALMKKGLFEKMGGFEHYKFSSDSIFAIKVGLYTNILCKMSIPVIKYDLFVWNRHSDSITMFDENSLKLKKCIAKQRKSLLETFDKSKINQMNDSNIKQYLGIIDNLKEDSKVNLKLEYSL